MRVRQSNLGHDSAARADGNRIGPELTRLNRLAGSSRRFLPILGPSGPARVLAPEGSLWQEPAACGGLLGRFPEYRACCRSSVVEHSIGNGEVDSSILSGSTIRSRKSLENQAQPAFSLDRRFRPFQPLRAEQTVKACAN